MDNDGFIQQLLPRYNPLSKRNLTFSVQLVDLVVAVPTTLVIWRAYGLTGSLWTREYAPDFGRII